MSEEVKEVTSTIPGKSIYGDVDSASMKDVSKLGAGIHAIDSIEVEFEKDKEKKDKSGTYNVIHVIFKDVKGSIFSHDIYEPSPLNKNGEPNKNYAKPAVELVYIAKKVQGKDLKLDDTVQSFEALAEWGKKNCNTTGRKGTLQLKTLPEKGTDQKYYNKIITYAPGASGSWGLGWLHNTALEPELKLSPKEAEEVNKFNNGGMSSGSSTGGAPTGTQDLPF